MTIPMPYSSEPGWSNPFLYGTYQHVPPGQEYGVFCQLPEYTGACALFGSDSQQQQPVQTILPPAQGYTFCNSTPAPVIGTPEPAPIAMLLVGLLIILAALKMPKRRR